MAEPIDYEVVILTSGHSFSGQLLLREQRLSDFLNNPHNMFLSLSRVAVARLSDPSLVLEQDSHAVVSKDEVLIAFEPPQKLAPAANRFYSYVRKEHSDVFIAMEGMEVRGTLHTSGPLELERFIAAPSDPFVPLTDATVTLQANTHYVIKQAAIILNVHKVRYVAKVGSGVMARPAPPAA